MVYAKLLTKLAIENFGLTFNGFMLLADKNTFYPQLNSYLV